jgi:hypothetical protein
MLSTLNVFGFPTVEYLKTRITSLRTQYTRAKKMLASGSPGLTARRERTLKKQRDLLGFLEPHLRKRSSKTNLVSICSEEITKMHEYIVEIICVFLSFYT